MSARYIVEAWLRFFNAGDSDGIATLYAENAVNHQAALPAVHGREAIKDFHRDTFADGRLTCIPVNLVVDGDWAALEWTDPEGFCGVRILPCTRRLDRRAAWLLG